MPSGSDERWKALFSGLKRTTGPTLSSGTPKQLLAEAAFKALAYALKRWGTSNRTNGLNRAKEYKLVKIRHCISLFATTFTDSRTHSHVICEQWHLGHVAWRFVALSDFLSSVPGATV